MFLHEMSSQEQTTILNFFKQNKIMIVSDIIRGRGDFCAEWMLVIRKTSLYEWVLKPI
jgi:R.HinP1I restriction endonuclease